MCSCGNTSDGRVSATNSACLLSCQGYENFLQAKIFLDPIRGNLDKINLFCSVKYAEQLKSYCKPFVVVRAKHYSKKERQAIFAKLKNSLLASQSKSYFLTRQKCKKRVCFCLFVCLPYPQTQRTNLTPLKCLFLLFLETKALHLLRQFERKSMVQ